MLIIETHEGTGLILDNNEALVKEMLGKFAAQIMICGKHIHLGLFKDEKDAAESYNIAAKSYFKEFANINKIIR
jgi:hypothetical protein